MTTVTIPGAFAIHPKYARIMHLGPDLKLTPVSDAMYNSLVECEGRELITESVTMEEIESTFFSDIPVSSNNAMLEAITSTRGRLTNTMRAFIRALNQQLNGTGITAGTDTAGASEPAGTDTGENGGSSADAQSIGGAIVGRVRNVNNIPILPAQIPLSDGQSVTVVFLSPTAEKKIAPGDQLVAFQFLLNKRDVTHVVAPMGGEDLSLKQVTLSLSNLAEKNSRKFKNAQARKQAQSDELAKMETESDNLETQLADISSQGDTIKAQSDSLQQQIDSVSQQADGVEAHVKELQAQLGDLQSKKITAAPEQVAEEIDPTTPEGYAKVSEDETLELQYQDQLDSFFQGRVIDVRNALKNLGWEGPQYKDLSKGGNTLSVVFKQVGVGGNIVSASYEVNGDKYFFMSDSLTMSAADLAAKIDNAVTPAQPEPTPEPEPEPTAVNTDEGNKVDAIRAQLQDLLDNETDIDAYSMKLEAAFNELQELGALDDKDPFLNKVSQKLTDLIAALGV
jgi:hypothetical protein